MSWKLEGSYFETCSRNVVCPCTASLALGATKDRCRADSAVMLSSKLVYADGAGRHCSWCRGEATRGGGDTVMPFAANIAVEIGGVCVVPGDYVYADASGAVVIPRGSLHRVIDEAVRVEAKDSAVARGNRRRAIHEDIARMRITERARSSATTCSCRSCARRGTNGSTR